MAYDLGDQQLTALMKPSLEEGFDYGSQDVCLDFIGKRGPTVGAQREKRIQYARELLRKEVLPHVGTEAGCENKKAFFIGYMVHRLLLAELGRINQDDRDHFGKKRLDMAGPLIAASFGTLYRKMMKDVRRILQRQVRATRCLSAGDWRTVFVRLHVALRRPVHAVRDMRGRDRREREDLHAVASPFAPTHPLWRAWVQRCRCVSLYACVVRLCARICPLSSLLGHAKWSLRASETD